MGNSTDLTKGSIYNHIKQISIPASTGLVFTTLYNVVDTFYAGQKVGTEALAGITLSFPIYFILIAIGSGLGAGATALTSISLGNHDSKKFHGFAYNSLFIGIVASILLMILNPLIVPFLLRLTGGEGQTLQEGLYYINILFYGAIFFISNAILNGILSAQGDTKSYRNFLIIGFFLNLILDPLFIMGWFNLPQLGTRGVALSTVMIMAFGTVYLSFRVIKSRDFDLKIFKVEKINNKTIKEILGQGIPSSLNTATTALGVFVINYFIVWINPGPETIAAYGAAMRIEQLVLIPTMGLNTAALAIVGQNFGAKDADRIREVHKKTLLVGFIMITALSALIYPFCRPLISIFNNDPKVIEAGVVYLHIDLLAEPTYVLLGILISILQGIKKPKFSVLIGLYRQIVIPFILIYGLSILLNWGIRGVWWSVFLSNWSATIITFIYCKRVLDKICLEIEK